MGNELKTGYFEQVATEQLIPYARNSRKHSPEQIDQIAASLREFGFLAPVVIAPDYTILAGHGRILAAQKIGLEYVPAVRAEHLTEAQRRAYVIVDNRLSETSQWDKEMLALELTDLDLNHPSIDMDAMGFSDAELGDLDIDLGGGEGGEGGGEGGDKKSTGAGSLAAKFGVPPFSVLNAREGWWQDRKRAWLSLGIKSEIGRGENLIPNGGGQQVNCGTIATGGGVDLGNSLQRKANATPGGSPRPACDYSKNKKRGDGAGRAIT